MYAEKYIKQIKSQLYDWIISIDFTKQGDIFYLFSKEMIKYKDHIGISVEVHDNKLVSYIQIFTRRIELVEDFWQEYSEKPLNITGGIPKTFGGSFPKDFLYNEKNQPKPIANWANWREDKGDIVERICEKVKSDYYTLVLPKLDEYSNIHKLDAIANGEDRTFSLGNSERYFRKLIISRLAGNPKYEEIYEGMTEMYKKIIVDEPTDEYYQNMLWVIEQLYEKLKNVQPLENPILI
jgi:hypothetical protein